MTSSLPPGVSRSRHYAAAKRGELVPVAPAAFMPTPHWAELTPSDRYLCAIESIRHARTLTGRSVLARSGIPLWPLPHEIDVANRTRGHAGLGARLPSGHQLRVHAWPGLLEDDDGGLRVTLPHALVLALTRMTFESGVIAADDYLRKEAHARGSITDSSVGTIRAELLEILESSKLRTGRGVARSVLEFADWRSESVGESRSRVLFHRHGLPEPELQKEIRLETGGVVRGDFFWKGANVIGEFDGRVKYGKHLRPGESPQEVALRERKREKILQQMGYVLVRWDWEDFKVPSRIVGWLRRQGVG